MLDSRRGSLDLATEWRSRRWRRLLNIIDHLPRNSHFVQASLDDEELAWAVVPELERRRAAEGSASRPEPLPLAEYSPEVDATYHLTDRVGFLIDAVVASSGGTPPRITPIERPETAFDRVRKTVRYEIRLAAHRSLVSRLLPNQITN